MRKDYDKTQKHFEEYKSWVRENKQIPTSGNARFSTGTKISTWRHNNRDLIKEFEESMKPVFDQVAKEKKDQAFFERECPPCYNGPDTLIEYLEGNNRYIYGDISLFISVMEYIHESSEIIPYLCLLKTLFRERYSWRRFHHDFDIKNLGSQMIDVIDSILDERHQLVIYHRFGLNGYTAKTLQEIGDMFGVSSSRIRDQVERALRKLRHPAAIRRIKRELISPPKDISDHLVLGHWFILYNGYRYHIVKKSVHELEEALEYFNCDWTTNDSEYMIRSVKTYNDYSWGVPVEAFIQMNIDQEMLLKKVVYQYTIVTIEQNPPRPSFEKYLERYLSDLRFQAAKERRRLIKVEKSRKKFLETYGSEIQERMGFIWVFNHHISEILHDHKHLDSNYEWLPWFNKGIEEVLVPVQHYQEVPRLVRNQLCRRMESFKVACLFTKYDEQYYTVQIQAGSVEP